MIRLSPRRSFQLVFAACTSTIFMAGYSNIAHADYLCRVKERELSATEKDMLDRGALALRAAFLSPPGGWTLSKPGHSSAPKSQCPDFKNSAQPMTADAYYTMHPTEENYARARDARRAMKVELDALAKLPPDLEAKSAELMKEGVERRREGRELSRAGDAAGAKAKQDEYMKVYNARNKLHGDYANSIDKQKMPIILKYQAEENLGRSVTYRIFLTANGDVQSARDNTEQVQFGSGVKTNQATDKIVRVIARIERDKESTAAGFTIAKTLIDRAKLQALAANKLPSQDELNAAIADQEAGMATRKAEYNAIGRARGEEERQFGRSGAASSVPAKDAGASNANTANIAEAAATSSSNSNAASATTTTTTKEAVAAKPATTAQKETPKTAVDTAKDAEKAVNKLKGLFGR